MVSIKINFLQMLKRQELITQQHLTVLDIQWIKRIFHKPHYIVHRTHIWCCQWLYRVKFLVIFIRQIVKINSNLIYLKYSTSKITLDQSVLPVSEVSTINYKVIHKFMHFLKWTMIFPDFSLRLFWFVSGTSLIAM